MNQWLVPIIQQFVIMMSPDLIKNLQIGIDDMCKKAATTKNPWDNILTGFLQAIVGKP